MTARAQQHRADAPRNASALLRPFTLGALHLSNRVVMSAMTRNFTADGVPAAKVVQYYASRARLGVGLIITEGVAPLHPVAAHHRLTPRLDSEAARQRWQQIVDAVHAEGGRIFLQLWHAGLGRNAAESDRPDLASIGPSGSHPDGHQPARAMDQADFDSVLEGYDAAARLAQSLGFDGINIHAAHGYLIDEFFWPRTNLRTDAYGGDWANRTRFAADVVRTIRNAVGPHFPIMLRFSQWKGPDYAARLATTPQELAEMLEPLAAAGVDMFDASTRRFWMPEFEGSALNLAGWAQRITGKPAMMVGSAFLNTAYQSRGAHVGDPVAAALDHFPTLVRMLESEVDLVGVGRALIANPDLVALLAQGRMNAIRGYDARLLSSLV